MTSDEANTVHYVTYVDYVEMFSNAYEGGLRSGDILVGIAIDDHSETLATRMNQGDTWETPKGKVGDRNLIAADEFASETFNVAFADHDWITSELRKAKLQLWLRIVREECVAKLQLYQRRIRLSTVLAVKRHELGELEVQLEAKMNRKCTCGFG